MASGSPVAGGRAARPGWTCWSPWRSRRPSKEGQLELAQPAARGAKRTTDGPLAHRPGRLDLGLVVACAAGRAGGRGVPDGGAEAAGGGPGVGDGRAERLARRRGGWRERRGRLAGRWEGLGEGVCERVQALLDAGHRGVLRACGSLAGRDASSRAKASVGLVAGRRLQADVDPVPPLCPSLPSLSLPLPVLALAFLALGRPNENTSSAQRFSPTSSRARTTSVPSAALFPAARLGLNTSLLPCPFLAMQPHRSVLFSARTVPPLALAPS